VRRIARPGETVLSPRADSFFGGKGANQAVAASRAGQGGTVRVAMAGAVGDDTFGRACADNLRDNGVDVAALRVGDDPTGCAFITVDDTGENAITVASGANMSVRAADVPQELISRASVLVMQMEVPLAECLSVADRARQAGAKVIWNFAPVPTVSDPAAVAELLAATDVLVVNEHEAIRVAEIVGVGAEDDYVAAASALAQTYALLSIVTAGAKGAIAINPDGSRIEAAARPITPVDTTGAGDTFVGVLANGFAEGFELKEALRRACSAASLSCLTPGAQAGMPTRDALERALTES
jgi:ribokinase